GNFDDGACGYDQIFASFSVDGQTYSLMEGGNSLDGTPMNPHEFLLEQSGLSGNYVDIFIILGNQALDETFIINSVTVTGTPLPDVDAGPDESICVGESVFLSASGGSNY